MIINFFKRTVHSFLGLSASIPTTDTPMAKPRCLTDSSSSNGLSLITATQDVHPPPPNVLESSAVKSTPPSRKDSCGLGFLDDIGGGGGVDGLTSCTESLGFESSDERRVDDLDGDNGELNWEARSVDRGKRRRNGERKAVKKFPPPISSLNQHGQPSFFLRPVRKDGRLALTEVRIDRPEILRASRENGRLRLHLIRDEEDDSSIDEEEEEAEEKEVSSEWKYPVGGEGFRRCNEVVKNGHGHSHIHGWRQQHCVTSS